MMFPNIWFLMLLFNIMKINYFQPFYWYLLKMNDFEEYNYLYYIIYSIISTIIYNYFLEGQLRQKILEKNFYF